MRSGASRAARVVARKALEPSVHWLDHKTRPARLRDGSTRLLVGNVKPTDILLSRIYWALSAWYWGRLSQAPGHLTPYATGLEWCAEPRRALDIGTGGGGSAAALAERFPQADVTGVDISRAMIAQARARHKHPNLRFSRAQSERLPFPDGSFDLITFLNAVPEMHELRRLLRPGGEVLVASTFSPLAERGASVLGRWADFGYVRERSEDVDEGAAELFRLPVDAPPPPLV
jgi:SAM-dependent methyltransferase